MTIMRLIAIKYFNRLTALNIGLMWWSLWIQRKKSSVKKKAFKIYIHFIYLFLFSKNLRKKVVGIGLLSASASLRRSLSLVLGARPLGDGMLRTERHTYPQLPALSAQCATHTLSWRHPGFEPWTFRSEGGSPTDWAIPGYIPGKRLI